MTTITRRAALGAIASIPAIGGAVAASQAAPAPAPAAEMIPQDRLLYAYSEWLHFERVALMREIYPGQDPFDMMRWVPCNTHAGHFHFPLRAAGLTETMPTPGTRALAVMTAAGVDLHAGARYAL